MTLKNLKASLARFKRLCGVTTQWGKKKKAWRVGGTIENDMYCTYMRFIDLLVKIKEGK